ncbi:MAG: hypothetical protein CVV41_19770 [Candidatus Riflebacteria bacterium HGW-Riflebacteria-1]|jgi:hypothetical protein|nr:MAG: hypothetical protein CVV41_19770 [Candidatus Riflebacteria bacterium HGW-Riflebacteria-1]
MNTFKTLLTAIFIMVAACMPAFAAKQANSDYESVVARVAGMTRDQEAREFAAKCELDIIDLTWEDTARFEGSSVGPNISDMTIQVHHGSKEARQMTCMPVIRFPNYTDKTADIPLGKLYARVGNEKGQELKTIPLGALLEDPRPLMSNPSSWPGTGNMLLAQRDSHVLVSAQACFLPIPTGEEATFNPVIFNYQSYAGNPAVLAILVTREGTSMTIIDNRRDAVSNGGARGQRLFFNLNGEKASLTGKRASDAAAAEPAKTSETTEPSRRPTAPAVGSSGGDNMVMLIQVPLKFKEPPRSDAKGIAFDSEVYSKSERVSNVEEAVIGHGEIEGPFVEMDNQAIERDDRYPIRVTVQFYKATDNGVVSEEDIKSIREQIDRVYADGTYVGSLVVPEKDGLNRPTDWKPTKISF